MKEKEIKLRFCPSPTGFIHLGNTRTALFNALYSHKMKGIFLLRIEDTDPDRSTHEFSEQLQEDLHWLGLSWQEGPGIDGGHGPYWQSMRQGIYDRYYAELESKDLAYHCFCSEEELDLVRKYQQGSGQPPRYAGTCRHLSADEVAQKRAQGLLPTLRFRVPNNTFIEFDDIVRGHQRFCGDDIGDFIVRRGDGTAPFMYCNAIDDALMEVTHVVRGADHLTNTPRQIMILQALGLPIPHYGHISLIVSSDGSRLSKRHGSRSVKELRQEGFFPQAITNYLGRLGHYYESNDYMSFDELAQRFSIERLGSAPARFDLQQLHYWQSQAVIAASTEVLWEWMGEPVRQLVPEAMQQSFVETIRSNVLFPEDALKWAQRFFADTLVYNSENETILQTAGIPFFIEGLAALTNTGADFSAWSNEIKVTTGAKGKALFQPLRCALTGEEHGPEMTPLVALLGQERIAQRLTQVITLLKQLER